MITNYTLINACIYKKSNNYYAQTIKNNDLICDLNYLYSTDFSSIWNDRKSYYFYFYFCL